MSRAIVYLSLAIAVFAHTAWSKTSRAKPTQRSAITHRPVKKSGSVQLRTAASVHGASRKTRGRAKAARTVRVAAPSYQLHPDSDRYQQIQKALAERGYYKGEVNGQWGDDSVDALKRFQADQKLDNDGRLNALTLTGLGLGPRHDGSTAGTVPLSAVAPAESLAPATEPETTGPPAEGGPQAKP